MMGEMVERVGAAILRARVGWEPTSPESLEVTVGRAAIEAMLEPTIDMAEAGDRSFERDEDSSGDYRIYSADAGKCWNAMIDKALA